MREGAERAVSRREDPDGVRLRRSGRLITAAARISGGSRPRAWLEMAPVRRRGAWFGRDGWAVYGGAVARLACPPRDRFRRLARRAEEAFGRDGGEEGDVARPRLYGGFSYGVSPEALWEGFPGGCFVLPRWEVRSTEAGPILLVHRLLEDDGPTAAGGGTRTDRPARDALEEAAVSLRSRMLDRSAGADAEAGGSPGPVGASRRGPPAGRTTDPATRTADGRGRDASGPSAAREERGRWLALVEEALEAIRAGRLRKVVLARSLDVPTAVGPLEALERLRSRPNGPGTFLVQPGGTAAFLGSSPELLAEVRGTRFAATAVAGSAERGGDPGEDREQARRLSESGKNRREQAIVAEDILERLSSVATAVRVSDPEILELPEIFHLESRVEARLPRRLHVLEMLDRLHPTPAVCGRPREVASAFLRRREALDRGWYAGPVGWFDLGGDGSFSPGLRSGLWTGDGWRLFAGAGIVDGSRARWEWEETELKLQAIRRGFGLTGS